MIQEHLEAVARRLAELPAPWPVVFAAVLAERTLPFANSSLARQAGVGAVLMGQLDRVWRHVEGIRVTEAEAEQLVEQLLSLPLQDLGDGGDFDSVDACRAVQFVVRACCNQAALNAVDVAAVALELAAVQGTPLGAGEDVLGPAAQLALLESIECLAAGGAGNDSHLRDVLVARLHGREGTSSVSENSMSNRRRVLFLCTGNSCRSQMAEGWLRHLAGGRFESLSAGAKPAGYVHPLAVQVMCEAGVEISQQVSKHIREFLPPQGTPPDLIISVCGNAEKECPLFPGPVERWHWPFDDPFHAAGSDEQRLAEFRRVRDEIKARIESGLIAAAT